jgi:hypothetical protein
MCYVAAKPIAVVVDVETARTDPERDRIIELGMCAFARPVRADIPDPTPSGVDRRMRIFGPSSTAPWSRRCNHQII